jgi:hypothetical protein
MFSPAFRIGGEHFEAESPDLAEALAAAYAAHHRPRCLCVKEGLEMYVSRLGDGYIIKRMPNTGCHHAPDCPSYEPPAELSGLDQVLGSAIKEDPVTGLTSLKLGFPMTKTNGRATCPAASAEESSVVSGGTRLTLRGLLHYLWDQAELTKWQPGFAGRRSWAIVRKHVLQAAENKVVSGEALRDRLYVPEVFSVERREEINSRRVAQWMHGNSRPGSARNLMLVIAEVKEIVQARYGFKAVLKHIPDQAFALDALLCRRMAKRFDRELSLWGASDNLHMILIATFDINDAGIPTFEELTLMPTSGEWIPIDNRFELILVESMVGRGRRFSKTLRYNAPSDAAIASAVLLDTGGEPRPLYINSLRSPANRHLAPTAHDPAAWLWDVGRSEMPSLPTVGTRSRA